jgi:outer membrane protein assembly factor BamB
MDRRSGTAADTGADPRPAVRPSVGVATRPLTVSCAVVLALGACGGTGDGGDTGPHAPAATAAAPARPAAARATNFDWPTFGLTPQRTSATARATGITAANAHRLRRRVVALPGTVDSSPIYLHGVTVRGRRHDVFVMTTTYGRTLAVDAAGGRILWTFAPRGIGTWAGTYRITNASPTADSDRRHVFTASPDGRIHRLALANGHEARGWPATITRLPAREKITASLGLVDGRVIAMTGGYIGDEPPYQGHVVALDRVSGRITGIVNSLCADRRALLVPSQCPSSDSAIWARSGAAVGPGGDLYVATGNAPYDGRTDFGDSVLRITPDVRRIVGHWTPADQSELNATDADLGSTGPVWLGGGYLFQSGKDAHIHLLHDLRQVQELPAPGRQGMFTAPAVVRGRSGTTVFATTAGGTAAYALRGGRLRELWSKAMAGTSPVVAGGLLYVYDPGGALVVLRPGSGRVVARLPAGAGHWSSPVIGGGRVALPEGNANDHRTDGRLNLYALP